MAALSHVKSSPAADFTGTITGFNSQGSTVTLAATDLVRPGDWNSAHNFFQTISGNTAGTSTASGTNLAFGATGGLTASHSTAAGAATLWFSAPNEPVLSRFIRPEGAILTTAGQQANNSFSVAYARVNERVTATRFNALVSVNVATTTNNSSAAINFSQTLVIHTLDVATLRSLSSSSQTGGMTWSSNATGSVTGGFFVSLPINVNMTPGNYYLALHMSTAATGNILTGAATTSLANTVTMLGVGTGEYGAVSFREPGSSTNSTIGVHNMGLNSSTGNLTQISMSNVSQVGTFAQRANIAFQLLA